MGIGAAWCAAFTALHLGGYGNQILMQFPNIVIFYGGLATVYILPKIEKDFEAYEEKLLEKEIERNHKMLDSLNCNAHLAIWMAFFDEKGEQTAIHFTDEMRKILGYSSSELSDSVDSQTHPHTLQPQNQQLTDI